MNSCEGTLLPGRQHTATGLLRAKMGGFDQELDKSLSATARHVSQHEAQLLRGLELGQGRQFVQATGFFTPSGQPALVAPHSKLDAAAAQHRLPAHSCDLETILARAAACQHRSGEQRSLDTWSDSACSCEHQVLGSAAVLNHQTSQQSTLYTNISDLEHMLGEASFAGPHEIKDHKSLLEEISSNVSCARILEQQCTKGSFFFEQDPLQQCEGGAGLHHMRRQLAAFQRSLMEEEYAKKAGASHWQLAQLKSQLKEKVAQQARINQLEQELADALAAKEHTLQLAKLRSTNIDLEQQLAETYASKEYHVQQHHKLLARIGEMEHLLVDSSRVAAELRQQCSAQSSKFVELEEQLEEVDIAKEQQAALLEGQVQALEQEVKASAAAQERSSHAAAAHAEAVDRRHSEAIIMLHSELARLRLDLAQEQLAQEQQSEEQHALRIRIKELEQELSSTASMRDSRAEECDTLRFRNAELQAHVLELERRQRDDLTAREQQRMECDALRLRADELERLLARAHATLEDRFRQRSNTEEQMKEIEQQVASTLEIKDQYIAKLEEQLMVHGRRPSPTTLDWFASGDAKRQGSPGHPCHEQCMGCSSCTFVVSTPVRWGFRHTDSERSQASSPRCRAGHST